MARGLEALVKPELLTWARKSAKYDIAQAARKIGISEDRLREWESGQTRPTISQLRKIAAVYHRPLAFFYLPEPPTTFLAMRDFRRLLDTGDTTISPELELEIRQATERRDAALELAEQLGEEGLEPTIRASRLDPPDQVAERIRQYLGVTTEAQFDWPNLYVAFRMWKRMIENAGVLVFQASGIPVEQMRGVSINERPLPVVILNGKDSPAGRIFTLIHEFIHLVLDEPGICDLHEATPGSGANEDIEAYCNRVAGSVLVPQDVLRKEYLVLANSGETSWTDDDIVTLARRYSVSREVILRRLSIIGAVSSRFYEQKRRQYVASYEELRRQEESGGQRMVPYFRKVLLANGLRYTRLVLSAYYEQRITVSDVSDYLNIRLKHLNTIEQELFKSSARA